MAPSAKRFAVLLQKGITAIANRTAKPKGVIRDELGYAIGRNGGSAIEYWLYGDGRIPSRPDEVERLARVLVEAGGLDRSWLVAFLESAGYPHAATLLAELFPTADQPPHNLPLPPTPFVGRTQELAALATLLADPACRLITLVGPGGSGKTRLAVETARNAHPTFADGAAFVALAPLLAADAVVPTVAATLNFTLDGRATPQHQLLHYLRGQTLLLVLDNFEHLLTPASASQTATAENPALALVTAILQQAPAVTMLVTSRERLNLQGEWVYDVGGLTIPSEDNAAPGEEYSALTLFLQTARRVQAGFAPTAADQAAIVRICQLATGMPLALELAAAWVRVLSCRAIAEEIATSLSFLTATQRDLSPRHRSMQAVFDHSWHLLTAAEQGVFARCSIFRGGFTREAATQVADATLPILTALVDKSLFSRQREGRYAIHELARQYAAERLVEAQQVAQTRNRHLAFFMGFAETAEPHLNSGSQLGQWHEWVENEHDNLRAALDWSFTSGELEPGLRIVGALWAFWMNRGYGQEGQNQAERFLARPEAGAPTYIRAKALHTAGVLAFYQGYFQVAIAWLTESIALSRTLGPDGRFVLAEALLAQGFTMLSLGDLEAAQTLSRESLALGDELQIPWMKGDALFQLADVARERGDDANARQRFFDSFACYEADGHSVMIGMLLLRLGEMLYEQGDYVEAQTYCLRSLALFDDLGDPIRGSRALLHLGKLAMAQDDNTTAQELMEKSLMRLRKVGQVREQIDALNALGRLAQRQGDYARARMLHQEGLTLSFERGRLVQRAHAFEALACLAARQGQAVRAATLFGAAHGCFAAPKAHRDLRKTLRDPRLWAEYDHLLAVTQTQLGEAEFAATWDAGISMDLAQAVAYALTPEPLRPR